MMYHSTSTRIAKKVAKFEAISLIPAILMAAIFSFIYAYDFAPQENGVDEFLSIWGEVFFFHGIYLLVAAVVIAVIAVIAAVLQNGENNNIIRKIAKTEALSLIPAAIMAVVYSCLFAREYVVGHEAVMLDDFLSLWRDILLAHVGYLAVVAFAVFAIVATKTKRAKALA